MTLNEDDIKHMAKLAKLELTEEEIQKFLPQLSNLLAMAEMLNEVDTSKVEPIAQITGINNMVYEDIAESFPNPEKLLIQSPQEIKDHMIKVKNIF